MELDSTAAKASLTPLLLAEKYDREFTAGSKGGKLKVAPVLKAVYAGANH